MRYYGTIILKGQQNDQNQNQDQDTRSRWGSGENPVLEFSRTEFSDCLFNIIVP